MANLYFDNVRFAALACAVPANVQNISLDPADPRVAYHKSFIRQIGISKRHISVTGQTCTDTGYVAAKAALDKSGLKATDIDVVVFMSQTPDFNAGTSNAFLLHNRLNMRPDTFAFDITLACSSFNFGLSVCAGYLQQPNIHKVLMVSGDTQWSLYKSKDQLINDDTFLGGEATTALILDDEGTDPLKLALYSNGSGYKYLFGPTEGERNKWNQYEFKRTEDGVEKEITCRYMDGLEITSFATTTVVDSLNQFMKTIDTSVESYDGLVLHQANKQIVKTIGRRTGFAPENVPMSLAEYANTDGASIPLTIIDAYKEDNREKLHLLTAGFGTGLSWGISDFYIDPSVIVPVIEVEDDRFHDDITRIK